MRSLLFVVSLASAALVVGGCVAFVPEPSDPRVLARDEARATCTGAPDRARELAPVESSEALYVRRPSKSGHETHLLGARLFVRPLPGVTPQLLERALRCHQARAALGEVPVADDDPWVLPEGWARIEVAGGGAALVVTVAADRADDARRILERASRAR